MKKKFIIILAPVLVLIAGVSVYAAGGVAHRLSISEETAQNFAFVDADVLPEEATVYMTEFEFEHGKFAYEIKFEAGGARYEYLISASDGSVLSREQEGVRTQQNTAQKAEQTVTPAPAKGSGSQKTGSTDYIGVQSAKEIALKDAGLKDSGVTFSKAKLEHDDGKIYYDIEFYVAGTREYEYEIGAFDGAILEKSSEAAETILSVPVPTEQAAPSAGQQKQTQTQTQQAQPEQIIDNGVRYEYDEDDGHYEYDDDDRYDFDDDDDHYEYDDDDD